MAVHGQSRPYALAFSLLCLLALFGSCCQMAPAVVGTARGWNVGVAIKYELTSAILSREAGKPRLGGDVGFQMTGELGVAAVWQDPKNSEIVLLRIKLESPRLWIKSRRAPEPEGFVEHTSKLDDLSDEPSYVVWKNGEIINFYLSPNETPSSGNLKRGLASILQYRTLDGDYVENDASGRCNVSYVSVGPRKLEKIKKICDDGSSKKIHDDKNPIFDVLVTSERKIIYELNSGLIPTSVTETEQHETGLTVKPEIGTMVRSQRSLKYVSTNNDEKIVRADNVEMALAQLNPGYKSVSINLESEPEVCPDSGCRTLDETINENREALDDSLLGTAKSASAFLKLLPSIRDATTEELTKILKSPRNRPIKTQLLDIIGSSSTPMAHKAAMKHLRQDDVGDDTERYLWALSVSPNPNPDVIKDVLKRSEETMQNDEVSETLAMTAGAMARHHGNPSVVEKVFHSLKIGLETCTSENCRLKFLRALKNLRTELSIPILLSHATNGSRSISAAAWRALSSLPRQHLTSSKIRRAAYRTFFQYKNPRPDSTCRTLAADLILENRPTIDELHAFLDYLTHPDPMFEIRRYVAQRIEQLSEKNVEFLENLKQAITITDRKLVNYNVQSYRGMSTAFGRSFLKSSTSNGTLVTVQEVNSGLLKRGNVDVIVNTGDRERSLFSLGLYAGGLSSFVSSSSSSSSQTDLIEDNPDDDETSTAGMEISFLGIGIRPFVFFTGQGELMGHVWSGTASERTPAYRAIANLHRHRLTIPLGSGFNAETNVDGAVSFDLAGQIQLSLWSRNARSLVEMSAGIAVRGDTRVRTEFVRSNAEFGFTIEPKLELSTNVDFSGPVALCMRLVQPETTIRHNVYKIERINESRHRLRKTRRTVVVAPARSYLLNRKNNEMCSKIFS